MMKSDKDYIDIVKSLNSIRNYNNKLNEEVDDSGINKDGIPYTQQDEIYNSTLESAKSQFGADFSQHKNPLIYYPEDGDVVLSGTISSLNNAKFQFRYKESDGCYFWVESLRLTDDNVTKLSRINGFYKNWRKDLEMAGDLKPMSMQNN